MNEPQDTPATLRTVPNRPQDPRTTLNLIRSIVGHADGHEDEAVAKIRVVLAEHGESVL